MRDLKCSLPARPKGVVENVWAFMFVLRSGFAAMPPHPQQVPVPDHLDL